MSQPPPWPPQPGGPGPQYPPYSQYPLQPVNGGLILALGILGLVFTCACGIGGVLGIVAWIMGNNAIAAIDRGEANPNERGAANAGRIMGIISTVLLALYVMLAIIAVANPAFRQGFTRGFNQSYHHTAPTP